MDYALLRRNIGNMRRGESITLPHPKTKLTVMFSYDGVFALSETNASTGSISAGFRSLKEFIHYVQNTYYIPVIGAKYQHINGNIYRVIQIANEGSLRPEYPPTVVYEGTNGKIWCKPMSNFITKMKRVM